MIRLALISIVLFSACSSHLKTQKVVKENTELLYGDVSKEQLYFDFPVWQEQENIYKPNMEAVKKTAAYSKDVHVRLFFGTWCGDSRRNVPRFFKSIKGNKHITVSIWAVDRKLKLDNNLPAQNKIERIPTFIFEQNGVEIGRIIENPIKTIEQDIVDILYPDK